MNCEEYQHHISRIYDGMVSAVDEPRVFEHLGMCNDCRVFFASLTRIRSGLRTTAAMAVPEGVDEKVLASIKRTEERPRLSDRPPVHKSLWQRTIPVPIPTFILLFVMLMFAGLAIASNNNAQTTAAAMSASQSVQLQHAFANP